MPATPWIRRKAHEPTGELSLRCGFSPDVQPHLNEVTETV